MIIDSQVTSENLCFPFRREKLGDNSVQNFHIVGYTIGNLVLCQCLSGAVKCDSLNEHFEYG